MKSVVVLLLALTASAACGSQPSVCRLDFSDSNSANNTDKATIQADLTKFTKAPLSANLENDFSSVTQETFQKIPDKAAACRLMLQTINCLEDPKRKTPVPPATVDKLIDVIDKQGSCVPGQIQGWKQLYIKK